MLALAFVTLALTGAGPMLASPVLIWTSPLGVSPHGSNVSVGPTGVYVTSGEQLSRYNFDGSVVWSRQIGLVDGVSVAPVGVYVAGGKAGNSSVGSSYGGTAFVGLYDFDGSMIWTRYFEHGFVGTALVSADSEAVYVAGVIFVSPNVGHSFVAKFDSSGNELWDQPISGRAITAISVGPKGVYVADHAQSFIHDSPSFADTYVMAIDFDGNPLWTKQLNNVTLYVLCSCLSTVAVGPTGIYVGETTLACNDSFCATGRSIVSFVRKYDFGGSEIWTTPSISATGISADQHGAYLAGGAVVQHFDSTGKVVWTFSIESQDYLNTSVSARGVFVLGASSISRLCASQSCIHN